MLKLRSTLSAFGLFALFAFASISSYGQKPQPSTTPNDVNVINTPVVVVGNSTDNPVAVRNVSEQARQPYQLGGTVLCDDNGQFSWERTFPVPEGKRFVIEHVSFRNWFSAFGAGVGIWVEIGTTFDGGPTRFRSLNFSRQEFGQVQLFVATHALLAYADGGTNVVFRATKSDANGSNCQGPIVQGLVTGYLVDAQ